MVRFNAGPTPRRRANPIGVTGKEVKDSVDGSRPSSIHGREKLYRPVSPVLFWIGIVLRYPSKVFCEFIHRHANEFTSTRFSYVKTLPQEEGPLLSYRSS